MARELFFLQNIFSCRSFLENRLSSGFSLEDFLGVGFFSCGKHPDTEGVSVKAFPKFLELDVADGIVNGFFSTFEKSSTLLHTDRKEDPIGVKRWMMMGLHADLFLFDDIHVESFLPSKDLLYATSYEDIFCILMTRILNKINDMKVRHVFLFLDIFFFSNYIENLFAWLTKRKKIYRKEILFSKEDLHRKFLQEFIFFVSSFHFHFCFCVFFPEQDLFEESLAFAKTLKTTGVVSDSLMYRL